MEPIKKFNTIGAEEIAAVETVLRDYPLSGYLAGTPRGGYWVQRLEEQWADRFGVKHAIACNSATSGLLAASRICRPRFDHQRVAVPCFTMSATAAAVQYACENDIAFMDCHPETFCSIPTNCSKDRIGMILVTNLFGQAAPLTEWRRFADSLHCCLIEDNAQAPFAMTEDGKYAGTVGDIGVFSLNVHKHLQAGEGGIIVTDNGLFASELRGVINHGELMGDPFSGLNLRMTETTAAIACCQLDKADKIISSRIELAEALTEQIKDIEFWIPPKAYGKHVYYIWAVKVPNRDNVMPYLKSEGVPVRAGYTTPLHRLLAFKTTDVCPTAERLQDRELLTFEVCSWDPTSKQIEEIGEIFKKAAGYASLLRNQRREA